MYKMRFSQSRTLFLMLALFSVLTLLLCWVLSEILFKESDKNIHRNREETKNYIIAPEEKRLLKSFQRNYFRDNIIADSYNTNNSINNASIVGCSSELFLTTCGNPGLAGLLLMTLDHISLCLNIGAIPAVSWRNCKTVCPNNGSINAWELFFEKVNFGVENNVDKVICLGNYAGPESLDYSSLRQFKKEKSSYRKSLSNLSFRHRDISGFDGLITPQVRRHANGLIRKYVKVLPKIQKAVDRFFVRYMKGFNILAVHIRGTDHWMETEDEKLPSLKTWIKNAEYHFNGLPSPKKIFVASDNSESIRKFIDEFGEMVIFTKAIRSPSYNGMPVHNGEFDYYHIGSEVLVDILLMSKCQHFLHAESSVASLVSFFNPEILTHFLDSFPWTKKKHKSNNEYVDFHKEKMPALKAEEKNDRYTSLNEVKEELEESFNCFKENKEFSICENMRIGKFIDFEETMY